MKTNIFPPYFFSKQKFVYLLDDERISKGCRAENVVHNAKEGEQDAVQQMIHNRCVNEPRGELL